MAKVYLTLDSRRVMNDGRAPLKIAVYCSARTQFISTGIALLPSEWNSRKGCTTNKKFANHIKQIDIKAQEAFLSICSEVNVDRLGVSKLKNIIKDAVFPDESRSSRGSFINEYERFLSKKSGGTWIIYNNTISRLRSFTNKLDSLNFEDITPLWLSEFESFLKKTSPSANARNIHLRNIRAVFNSAITNEVTSYYPFRRFKLHYTPTRKRALPINELRRIFSLPPCEATDMFKLIFMLIGINSVDLYNADTIENNRLIYTRAKTHKPYSVKIEPEAMDIINRYRGRNHIISALDTHTSYRTHSSRLNLRLKKATGLKDITYYWARHSWATIAASLDIPKETIAAALGHSGNTVTDIYIDFDQRKVDAANRKVLDYVLSNTSID